MIPAVPTVSTSPVYLPQVAREYAGEDQVELLPFGFAGSEIEHPSVILQTRSAVAVGGRSLRVGELYEEMLGRDGQLAGHVEKRAKAVTGLPRWVEPANATPKAIEIRDFVRRALEGIPSFAVAIRHLLGGIPRSTAFLEVIWSRGIGELEGAWVPAWLVDRPMWRFGYRLESAQRQGRRESKLFVRRPGITDHVDAPTGKFIVYRFGSLDNPWGRAPTLFDALYWPWFLKIHAAKYYAVAVERWAQPFVMALYGGAGNEQGLVPKSIREELESVIASIQTEGGAVIPKGVEIKLLEAQRSGEATYDAFLGYWDRVIAMVLLGEVDTSGLSKSTGSYAKARVSDNVRLETIREDAHELSVTLREQLIRPIVALNFGRAEALSLCPRFVVEVEDAEDVAQRQAAAAAVLATGEPIAQDEYYRVHRLRVPRDGEPVVKTERAITDTGGVPLREAA